MEPRGLYDKYIVQKANGETTDPDARYFVLRLDTDVHARRAAHAYIASVWKANPALAGGLASLLAGLPSLVEAACGHTVPIGETVLLRPDLCRLCLTCYAKFQDGTAPKEEA
jgi:hypothetical protein